MQAAVGEPIDLLAGRRCWHPLPGKQLLANAEKDLGFVKAVDGLGRGLDRRCRRRCP